MQKNVNLCSFVRYVSAYKEVEEEGTRKFFGNHQPGFGLSTQIWDYQQNCMFFVATMRSPKDSSR